jgi:hypothetical protein
MVLLYTGTVGILEISETYLINFKFVLRLRNYKKIYARTTSNLEGTCRGAKSSSGTRF